MQQKELSLRFDTGDLLDCVCANAPLASHGWVMLFNRKTGEPAVLHNKHGGKPRVFKTLKAAANTAREIGFREMTVSLSASQGDAG